MNKGRVIKSTGSWYHVQTDEGLVKCKIRGKFRTKGMRSTNPVAVGDRVRFKFNREEGKGLIISLEERKNFLVRKSTNLSRQSHIIAANIDYAFLLVTLIRPVTYPLFIDRYLVACESRHIQAALIFNKIDLHDDELNNRLSEYIQIYENAGYDCIPISVNERINLDIIERMIKGKTIVISGNSGVGKTSLLNTLEPGLHLKINEISEYHKQGKHTTTFAEMHKVKEGFIIDTPGIKGFGLDGIDMQTLSDCFPEMRQLKNKCKFNNCSHTHEPDCAVKDAVSKQAISSMRYKNYLNILSSNEEEKYRHDDYA